MSRRALTSVFTAAAIALALPAYAQDKGARPNPSGHSAGSAVSRPSGGGSSGGGSSSSSSGGGGSMSSPASNGSSGPSGARPNPSGGGSRGEYRAPSAPERRSGPAVSRTSSSAGDENGGQRRVSPGGANASASENNGDRRRAVPAYSRPRDGRPVIGTAVERTGRAPVVGGGYYYDPYYRYSYYYNRYPYGYFYPGYGLGVGYFYDPWMWGYASPFYYGGGYGGGYYGGGSYSGSYYNRGRNRDIGGIRLKVKPERGQVYVDGYYVGEVDSFDGVFQRLNLESGAHRIEIRAEGYTPEQFEVMVIPGETITYKGDLKRIQ